MTQICPNCQQSNRAEAKFCARCGTALPGTVAPAGAASIPAILSAADSLPCPQCGKSIGVKAKYCNYCGQSLTGISGPQVAAPALPQITAQPTPQPVPPPVPAAAPQVTNTAPAPQSPPPYAPPAFTPRKRKGLSRREKIIVGITGVVVLTIIVGGIVVVASQIPPQPNTATGTITVTLPAVAPTSTVTPLKIATQSPTATLLPTQVSHLEGEYIVQDGENLESIVREHCKGILDYKIHKYTREIIKVNDKEWNDWPTIYPGDVLKLPSCPR